MRKNILLTLLILTTVLTACKKKTDQTSDTPCEPKACTLNLASIIVKYINSTGQPVVVTNYKAVNARTGLELKYTGANDPTYAPGYYRVASDGNLKELSDDGDEIIVTATYNGQTKIVKFKIAGGCACHVSKTSGPEEVAFN